MLPPGRLVALRRHPLKGFTPERLESAGLEAGQAFPGDRLWAVENGPSGFDPAAPKHLPKSRFTVLAQIAAVARVRTRLDDATGVLTAEAEGREPFLGRLTDSAGRTEMAAWLEAFLQAADPEAVRGPLRVVSAEGHRFMDDPRGHVSLLNLESVRDLGRKVGAELDPERFRCNLHVEGWPAWAELAPAEGTPVQVGAVELSSIKPIRRCAATHVDPTTAVRDLDLVGALREHYGHFFCGLYLRVEQGGRIAPGDAVTLSPPRDAAA